MRKIIIILLLAGFILLAGCTSYYTNLTAPKRNLQLNQTAIFEQEGYLFRISVDRISIAPTPAGPADSRTATVTITLKNPGTKGISLVGYPRLTDGNGKEYAGTGIFFGAVNPGGSVTGKSSIPIESAADFAALQNQAVLGIRLQGVQPTPWEADWDVNVNRLPPA